MARILFVHIRYPEFDRCSGDVRVTNMLRILSARHEVALHVLHQPPQYIEGEANALYARTLQELGIRVESGSLARHLRQHRYDVVVIEFWYVAGPVLREIRALQPQARVIVDTEHIYFYSDRLRSAVLGSSDEGGSPAARKRQELAAYRAADGILTTTDEDRDVVLAEDGSIPCRTVTNIHALPPAPVGQLAGRRPHSVVFVGNFHNNPSNADAMIWFCREVMPRLRRMAPDASLRIVGNRPPSEVQTLACDHVEVTGYVPDTAPYLDGSMVSVCPLRFGAGLKGKIGEAMSHGLPVVSTSVGTQGMTPLEGKEILVADDPDAFAAAIARLFNDPALWQQMSMAGRDFIERHFGFAAVERQLARAFDDLAWLHSRRLAAAERWALAARLMARDAFDQHVRWRLQR